MLRKHVDDRGRLKIRSKIVHRMSRVKAKVGGGREIEWAVDVRSGWHRDGFMTDLEPLNEAVKSLFGFADKCHVVSIFHVINPPARCSFVPR